MFVSIYYKPSFILQTGSTGTVSHFTTVSMILIVHIFMNVNKLCLNHVTTTRTLQSWPWTHIFNRGMCVDQCGQAYVSLRKLWTWPPCRVVLTDQWNVQGMVQGWFQRSSECKLCHAWVQLILSRHQWTRAVVCLTLKFLFRVQRSFALLMGVSETAWQPLWDFCVFTASICKISGLKNSRTRLQTVYFSVL